MVLPEAIEDALHHQLRPRRDTEAQSIAFRTAFPNCGIAGKNAGDVGAMTMLIRRVRQITIGEEPENTLAKVWVNELGITEAQPAIHHSHGNT